MKTIVYDNEHPVPCKKCGNKPHVIELPGSLFYAQCKCGKWDPYEFVGITKQAAVENWNTYNKPGKPSTAIGLED